MEYMVILWSHRLTIRRRETRRRERNQWEAVGTASCMIVFSVRNVYTPCSFGLICLISHGWNYSWLIWCERKILFVGWKSTTYKWNKPKRKFRYLFLRAEYNNLLAMSLIFFMTTMSLTLTPPNFGMQVWMGPCSCNWLRASSRGCVALRTCVEWTGWEHL